MNFSYFERTLVLVLLQKYSDQGYGTLPKGKEKKKNPQLSGDHKAQRKGNRQLLQSITRFPTLMTKEDQTIQRKDKEIFCSASTSFPPSIQYDKAIPFVKSSERQMKSLPLTCTGNHLYSFTPFHFREHPPSKTFCQYCQVNIYYSCNFPNLLSEHKQNGLICSKYIKNKEDNFAKFHSAFFLLLFIIQVSQEKQMPP